MLTAVLVCCLYTAQPWQKSLLRGQRRLSRKDCTHRPYIHRPYITDLEIAISLLCPGDQYSLDDWWSTRKFNTQGSRKRNDGLCHLQLLLKWTIRLSPAIKYHNIPYANRCLCALCKSLRGGISSFSTHYVAAFLEQKGQQTDSTMVTLDNFNVELVQMLLPKKYILGTTFTRFRFDK